MSLKSSAREGRQLKEIYLPAAVLALCLSHWEQADDAELTAAVGEMMEHGYWHWRWLAAVRAHRCRLVVVQHKDAAGRPQVPHYQIGELFTLSQWHPERALAEAQTLANEGAEGLTFDVPVDDELLAEWDDLADAAGLEDENSFELLLAAMVLLDAAHDHYVEELGDDFYIATRGLGRDMDKLLVDPAGRWSLETVQVVDKGRTVGETAIFPAEAPGVADLAEPVPVAYQPTIPLHEDGDDGDDEDLPPAGFRLN